MNAGHRAHRPQWTCIGDGLPWPCAEARAMLVKAFPDRIVLLTHLARLSAVAADDLGIAGPVVLFPRFVGWAMAPDELCRACGSPRHVVVPGAPPRLSPCRRPAPEAGPPDGSRPAGY